MAYSTMSDDTGNNIKIALPSSRAEFVYVTSFKYLFSLEKQDITKVTETIKTFLEQYIDQKVTQTRFLSSESFLIELCKSKMFMQIEAYRHLYQQTNNYDIEMKDEEIPEKFLFSCSTDKSHVLVKKEENFARQQILKIMCAFKEKGSIFGIFKYLLEQTISNEDECEADISDLFNILEQAAKSFEAFYKKNIKKASFTSDNPFFDKKNTKKLVKNLKPDFEKKLSSLLNTIVASGGITEVLGENQATIDKNTYIMAVIRNMLYYLGIIFLQPYKPGEAFECMAIRAQSTIKLYDPYLKSLLERGNVTERTKEFIHSHISIDKLSWDCSMKIILFHFAMLAYSDFFDSPNYNGIEVKLDDILSHINTKSCILHSKNHFTSDMIIHF